MGPKEFNMPSGLTKYTTIGYKFRILQEVDDRFTVQKRFLFFWITSTTRRYHHLDSGTISYRSVNFFDSIKDAELFIQKSKISKEKKKRRVVKYIM